MGRFKSLEHGFKSLFAGAAGPFLSKGRRGSDKLDGTSMRKVLFLRPEKLGDMVISFPIFDALKLRYPQIQISVLGSPTNYAIIKDDPRFDQVFLYTKNLMKDIRTIKAIRREKYDCVLDMINDDSVTSLFLSQLTACGSPRVGIGKRKYAGYYDYCYGNPAHPGEHIVEDTLGLLKPFDIDIEQVNRYAPPYVPQSADRKIQLFLNADGNRNKSLKIGFNLSAGKPNRIWDGKNTEKLARKLLSNYDDIELIVITAPADRQRGEALIARLSESVAHVPPGLTLLEVSALISHLDLLISPDTSLIHIARSFRVPVVGLYSRARKNLRLWRPLDQPDGYVISRNDDNIFDITADTVFRRVRQVLKRERTMTG